MIGRPDLRSCQQIPAVSFPKTSIRGVCFVPGMLVLSVIDSGGVRATNVSVLLNVLASASMCSHVCRGI